MDMFPTLTELTTQSHPGGYFKAHVTDLKPTQESVGMDEVNEKQKGLLDKFEKGTLAPYLQLRPVPVVIGGAVLGAAPYYMIDHHHLASAMWEAASDPGSINGFPAPDEAELVVRVEENWSFIDTKSRFWKAMHDNSWVYPYRLGGGPNNVAELPAHVKDLINDPYRSLAWYVRKESGYFKDPGNPIFAEFKWANFFRHRVVVDEQLLDPDGDPPVSLEDVLLAELKKSDREEVIREALAWARSGQAFQQPGYLGST